VGSDRMGVDPGSVGGRMARIHPQPLGGGGAQSAELIGG